MTVNDVPAWFNFEKKCDGNTIRVSGVTKYLPDGWSKFGEILDGVQDWLGADNISLKYKNGVLYVIATTDNPAVNEAYRRIAQTIMMDSARTCIVCGNRGSRRKGFGGQPPLCREHFLEYINTIEV